MGKQYFGVRVLGEACDIITNSHPFFDVQGHCYLGIPSEAMKDYDTAFKNAGGIDSFWDVCVLVLDETGNRLIGWYERATAYSQEHHLSLMPSNYVFTCSVQDAYLMPVACWGTIPASLHSSNIIYLLDSFVAEQWLNSLKGQSHFRQIRISIEPSKDRCLTKTTCLNDLLVKYEEEGDISLAIEMLWYIDQQEKQDAYSHDIAGYALTELAMPEKALSRFEKALEVDAGYRNAMFGKGECLIRLDRPDDAVKWFNEVMKRYPDDEVRFQLATAYGLAGYDSVSQKLIKMLRDPEVVEQARGYMREDNDLISSSGLDEPDLGLKPYPIINAFEKLKKAHQVIDTAGHKGYLDPVRGKIITASPEETIRQSLLHYMLTELGVPIHSIRVEESLAHLDRSLRERVDVLVLSPNGAHLMLVECKAPDLPLQGEPTRQLIRYNRIIKAPYILLTNGRESYVYHYHEENSTFVAMQSLPNYLMMLGRDKSSEIELPNYHWRRPAFEIMNNSAYQMHAYWEGMLGEATPDSVRPAVLNLGHALLDEMNRIPMNFEIKGELTIEDRGCLYLRLGNASGGGYPGRYRWLVTHNAQGLTSNVYLGVFGTSLVEGVSGQKTRGGYTSLICASDENAKAISRLQINLDRYLIPESLGHNLTHNGRWSQGNAETMITHVFNHAPELLGKQQSIMLGHLDTGKELRLSDPQTAEVIGNLAIYVLLRSQLHVREGKKTAKSKRQTVRKYNSKK